MRATERPATSANSAKDRSGLIKNRAERSTAAAEKLGEREEGFCRRGKDEGWVDSRYSGILNH